jgi:hypothetical protein
LIVDVGGAEGYDAIGCALRWPEAQVVAYELRREARQAIAEMAIVNGVRDRVTIHAECTPADLHARRGLVICDIEGFEEELLLRPGHTRGLADCDWIIETHDLFRPGVFQSLWNAFSRTHHVTAVDAIPDRQRPGHWRVPELSGASRHRQSQVLGERRGGPMKWLVCQSKRPFPRRNRKAASAAA